MDLKAGSLAWPVTLEQISTYPPISQDEQCDIVVVGGGMSGALTAYELSRQGYRTIVVDKRSIGTGSTCANTGLLQFCNDKMLTACIHTFGQESGVRFYTLCKQAVQRLFDIRQDLITDPELYERSSLYYASTEEDVPILEQEFNTLTHYGFTVEWWDKEKIQQHFGFTKPAALLTHGDAEVNPFKMVHALLETSVAKYNLRIFEHTRILRHQSEQPNEIILYTDQGHHIKARHAVFATGYETQEMKHDRNAVMESTFAIVTQPIPNLEQLWHKRMLIWETARPYLYMRTTPDNRIVAGGLDENTTIIEERNRMLPNKSKQLVQEIEQLFPDIAPIEAEYEWAALFGSTHDGYPMIGPHPKYSNCTFIEVYGGNGTVYSSIAASMIIDLVENGTHPDADLFTFQRSNHPSPPH
ncbi:NAD(P)/FAD-dependent oxidoreductase [Paenibacillus arenosi]|uniref:FAD-binding oxidoreductase n=1 Tax=Paenibacillus arenosi TaxID=2774142 RepID=A0ABR9B119_9BACL|nr:FAD-dependent oxidoreductase [Paenibacillus arenosi]MBD8499841.1 FAD-binding oxidoreductase [Paenibacillus arenosi]